MKAVEFIPEHLAALVTQRFRFAADVYEYTVAASELCWSGIVIIMWLPKSMINAGRGRRRAPTS